MDRRRRRSRLGRHVLVFGLLTIIAVVMLFPFLYMALVSFRSYEQFLTGSGFGLDSWRLLFESIPVPAEFINSSVVSLGAVLLILAVSTTGGYAFGQLGFPGSATMFLLLISGMMIPVQSIIIPEYVNVSQLGLINKYPGALIVYAALGAPFATYLMTAYFRGVPAELLDAAVIDGASYWQCFRTVMLPIAVPAMVTVAVLQFIQIWGDLLVGLLFLQTPAVRTITVGLATLQSSRVINIPVLMAGSLVSAVPAIIVYLVFQRYLIRGMTMGIGK